MNTPLCRPTRSAADRIRHHLIELGQPAALLTDHAHFTRDLGMDSLDAIDLLIRVESEFSIRIADHDWHRLRTIDALTEYLLLEEGIGVNLRRSQPVPLPDCAVC